MGTLHTVAYRVYNGFVWFSFEKTSSLSCFLTLVTITNVGNYLVFWFAYYISKVSYLEGADVAYIYSFLKGTAVETVSVGDCVT